jgi:hypothetical protein
MSRGQDDLQICLSCQLKIEDINKLENYDNHVIAAVVEPKSPNVDTAVTVIKLF